MKLAIVLSSFIGTACSTTAIPPSRIAIGGGVAVEDEQLPEPAIDLRWSVHPLGIVEHVRARRVDVGMGYGALVSSLRAHGPELFGEYFFLPGAARGKGWRAGLLGSAQVLFTTANGRDSRGFGGGLGLDLEHTGFALTDRDHALGEWAFGLYSTARYGEADDLRFWSVVGGLEARVPLVADP